MPGQFGDAYRHMICAAVPLCAAAGSDDNAAHASATSWTIGALAPRSRQLETNAATDRIIPPHFTCSKNAADCCVTKYRLTVSNCTHLVSAG
jgi:hypothetical protein